VEEMRTRRRNELSAAQQMMFDQALAKKS
jgi:hypothetical protein